MTVSRKQYFQSIERLFVELRGAPLLLSPSDWQAAKTWFDQGIPLPTVESAVREVFERHDERREADRINSLRYCAAAVAKEWQALREIQGPGVRSVPSGAEVVAGGAESRPGPSERLDGLANAIVGSVPDAAEWRRRIQSLDGEPDQIEAELALVEEQLLASVEAGLSEDDQRRLEDEVVAGLVRVRGRLSDPELERLRTRLKRQVLRRLSQVPRLTLFH